MNAAARLVMIMLAQKMEGHTPKERDVIRSCAETVAKELADYDDDLMGTFERHAVWG